jgi:hypothetical protein
MRNNTYHPSNNGAQQQLHQRDEQSSRNGSSGAPAPAPASVEALKARISVLTEEVAQALRLRNASNEYNSPFFSLSQKMAMPPLPGKEVMCRYYAFQQRVRTINQVLLSIQLLVLQDLPYSAVIGYPLNLGLRLLRE